MSNQSKLSPLVDQHDPPADSHGHWLAGSPADSIVGDLLRGAKAIAAFVGVSERRAYYLLERGYLPGVKEGAIWICTRSALLAHYRSAPSAAVVEHAATRASTEMRSQAKITRSTDPQN